MAGNLDKSVSLRLPADLVDRLDRKAGEIDRPRSWIVRHAISEWLREWDEQKPPPKPPKKVRRRR